LLMRAMGVPLCVRKCIDPFLDQISEIWHMNQIVEKIPGLCRSHPQALECLRKQPSCDTHNLFKKASSSVQKVCGERAALFEKMRPCLSKNGDAVARTCDARCSSRATLTAFMNNPAIQRAAKMGGNIMAVNDNLGPLCSYSLLRFWRTDGLSLLLTQLNNETSSVLNCELACITTELNKVCPLSGWLTLDILLQPFESVADLLLESSPSLKDFLAKKMDKRCRFVLQKSELMKLRKGQFNL
uniref:CPG4 domain-containing protein n=1 Tax=Heligmosomoides polygyrus TaxID=6339 RepID=A0A183F602_HELPZ